MLQELSELVQLFVGSSRDVTVYASAGAACQLTAGFTQKKLAVLPVIPAENSVGAPGGIVGSIGLTAVVSAEGLPTPTAFDALTVMTYEMPLDRPVIVQLLPARLLGSSTTKALQLRSDRPCTEAVYRRIGEFPSQDGGDQVTVACLLPATAVAATGAKGTRATGGLSV